MNSKQDQIFKIVILGPQGSGKGTQAQMLSERLKTSKITPGDLFRQEIDSLSDLGKKLATFMNKGYLVPDEIANKLVARRLSEDDVKKGFILDGFPRNFIQAEALEKMAHLTHALEIWISDQESLTRLGGRRTCRCGQVYHLKYKPPKQDELCDICGAKLFIRDDDKPQAIKKRLQIYHQETEPLMEFYRKKGILLKINGEQSIPQVSQEIVEKLGLL